MKVSMRIYGEEARTLARELGLQCSNKTADLLMAAHFTYRSIEGHTVVSAEFTSNETAQKIEKTPEQKQKEALLQNAECARLRAELAGFLTEAT